jgi:hypothetical protein
LKATHPGTIPGMKFKKNLLLWNYWANLNQTLLKWFLDGPLPKLCPVIPTSNQDGRQAQNRNTVQIWAYSGLK